MITLLRAVAWCAERIPFAPFGFVLTVHDALRAAEVRAGRRRR